MAILAVAGLASALLSGANGRRLELAILRAIGFTPREIRSCMTWQALTAACIGLLFGVPLGLIAARAAWSAFARTLSLDDAIGLPWATAVAVMAGCSVVAVVAAVPVGQRWSRRPVTEDLRVD